MTSCDSSIGHSGTSARRVRITGKNPEYPNGVGDRAIETGLNVMNDRTDIHKGSSTLLPHVQKYAECGRWLRRGSTIVVLPSKTLAAEDQSYELPGGRFPSLLRGLKRVPSAALSASPMQVSTGVCSSRLDGVIRGWGQYQDTVQLLPAPEQAKIAQMADLIVESFTTSGCIPLGQIVVIGHADKDLHGTAFEKKVSDERAKSVAAALSSAIIERFKQRGIQRLPKGAIAFIPSPAGVGATQPDQANIPRVTNRLLNRRVEVHVRQRGAPVPPPDTLQTRVARFLALLNAKKVDPDPSGKRTGRAVCILKKILRPGVLDVFVDGTAANTTVGEHRIPGNLCSFTGNYDPPPLSNADLAKFLGGVKVVLRGPGFAPRVSDEQILKGLSQLIFMINEGIIRDERYITLNSIDFGYTGDQTRGRRLSSIFADHLDDQNSIYSCYKDFRGNE
jgi:hypothetical protein